MYELFYKLRSRTVTLLLTKQVHCRRKSCQTSIFVATTLSC